MQQEIYGELCLLRDIEQIQDDMIVLKKCNMTLNEFTRMFNDMLPFLASSYPTKLLKINRFVKGLP